MLNEHKLLIFDIDGTLTDSGGLTRVALEKAAFDFYGVERTTAGIAAWGQTDLNIFQLMVENNNLPVDDVEAAFGPFSERYTKYLEDLIYASPRPRLHNGIRDLLERLVTLPDMCLAIGTGNIEPTGRMKLKRHSVEHLFPIGGFGSDSSDRATLLLRALDRGREHYGHPFDQGYYWVIGDTPNDIESGRKIGAKTVGVCTGTYKAEELAGHNPDAIFPDLTDIDRFIALVRGHVDLNDGNRPSILR